MASPPWHVWELSYLITFPPRGSITAQQQQQKRNAVCTRNTVVNYEMGWEYNHKNI